MPPVVVIRPQSGYANRLQAIASGWILADTLQSRLVVDWIPDPDVAPVQLNEVLDPRLHEDFQDSSKEILQEFGITSSPLSPYFHFDSETKLVSLAGMDRGEQCFMPELKRIVDSGSVRAIVISAGGKFTLDGAARLTPQEEAAFRRKRMQTYERLLLHPDVERQAARAIGGRQDFCGLHLRYSDRALESPWSKQITSALSTLRTTSESENLFVASDSAKAKERWIRKSAALGWKPWTVDSKNFPRHDPRSSMNALIDWRILTKAVSLVYFRASSFAEEASVAGGSYDRSTGLLATPARKKWMQARDFGLAAVTYPRRHDWW